MPTLIRSVPIIPPGVNSSARLRRLWAQLPVQVRESLLGLLSRIVARQLQDLVPTKEGNHDRSKPN
jgi:hypothetical protein